MSNNYEYDEILAFGLRVTPLRTELMAGPEAMAQATIDEALAAIAELKEAEAAAMARAERAERKLAELEAKSAKAERKIAELEDVIGYAAAMSGMAYGGARGGARES